MLETLLLFVFVMAVILCVKLEIYKWQQEKKMRDFVSVTNYPVIGYAGQIIGKSPLDLFNQINSEFFNLPDSVVAGRAWIGAQLVVSICHPNDLRIVLTSEDCIDRPYIYSHLNMDNGLLASPKTLWRPDRRSLSPTLNGRMVASFMPIFNSKAMKCCEIILSATAGTNVDFHRVLLKCLLDMHFLATFQTDLELQTEKGDVLYDSMMTVMKHVQMRVWKPWLKWDFVYRQTKNYDIEMKAFNTIHRIINEVTVAKSAEFNARFDGNGEPAPANVDVLKSARGLTFLEKCFVMLREGKSSEKTLYDHLYTLTAAAVDTSTSTIFNVILMLAIHQDVQEKVLEELREIFPSADSPITTEDISRMIYTEMVIKETLRILPVAPMLGRQATADIKIKSGTIPKGAIILLNVEKIHKHLSNWGPNSHVFDPERFAPDKLSSIDPYAFLAFSAGPRNCIGIKYAFTALKIMLAHFLRQFEFRSDLRMEDIQTELHIVLKVSNPNPFYVKKREFK